MPQKKNHNPNSRSNEYCCILYSYLNKHTIKQMTKMRIAPLFVLLHSIAVLFRMVFIIRQQFIDFICFIATVLIGKFLLHDPNGVFFNLHFLIYILNLFYVFLWLPSIIFLFIWIYFAVFCIICCRVKCVYITYRNFNETFCFMLHKKKQKKTPV